MLAKIKPAVKGVLDPQDINLRNSSNAEFVDHVAAKNVQLTIERIIKESDVLADMQDKGEVKIIGAMYDINKGTVTFYE